MLEHKPAVSSHKNCSVLCLRKGDGLSAGGKKNSRYLSVLASLDKFLGIEMAQPSIDLCENGRLVIIKGATHWVQHEKVEQVNSLITSFFKNALND